MLLNTEIFSKITDLEKELGKLEVCNPQLQDLDELISLYEEEDLDKRKVVPCVHESFESRGNEEVRQSWNNALLEARTWVENDKLPWKALEDIRRQAAGILAYQLIPEKGTLIHDPFNMKLVEQNASFVDLKKSQLENIVVIKVNNQIASSARVLYVEGSWEIVSIVTKSAYRGKGLASTVIQIILDSYPQRPLFSFQKLSLVGYYLREFWAGEPSVCLFNELPHALQRDLFRMNIFWEPNVIIRISR